MENKLNTIFKEMSDRYNAEPYTSYKQRKEVLLKLKKSIIANEYEIYEALKKDYGYRSEFDTLIADVMPSVAAINYSLKHLKSWMKPSKRHSGLLLAPSTVNVHYQPLGVVGVITPWNFPIFLALSPTIQALAAGNRVMIKMSEFTPATNKALAKILEPIEEHVALLEGEKGMGEAFSKLPFDSLIFTGSTTVGKHVAKAAAENLTPVTLELGGKSPTIIAPDSSLKSAVDAIITGKATNSGQICVAPDYVFVPKEKEKEFVELFIERYKEYYIDDENSNRQTQIVTDKQFARIQEFLVDAEAKGAKINKVKKHLKKDGRRIYPHIITNVNEDMDILKEEIFGSILPVITYNDIEEVIGYINSKERPLALYIMSKNNKLIDYILKNTHSGGVSINDTAMHVMADDAPFGGVGHSGIGHYHGHEGFLTFSKAKTVLHSPQWLPKQRFILKNRDFVFKAIRALFLR